MIQNITLKQLRYLDAVLRYGSISKAAEELNISQSSVTAAVDQIEQAVGAELFRRIPAKGIVPTRIGELTGRRVAEFLEQARIFHADLMSITGEPKGTLRLACYEPTAPYVLPPLLRNIANRYPDLSIDIIEGDMGRIDEMLQAGKADVALTYRRSTHPDLRFTPFFAVRPWVIVPDSWPVSRKPEISLEDLVDLPMILLDLHGTQSYFVGLFEDRGLTPTISHRTRSGAVLRGLVAAQLGYSILNICGPSDRTGETGYVAAPLKGKVDIPTFGAAHVSQLDQSAMVRAVVTTGRALARDGSYDALRIEGD